MDVHRGDGASPLTFGTAGHIDHGKTALVAALTGRDTDRLPAEKARGISIELGYAPLDLSGGRRVSVVDLPGHERFVRTMVAGATGVDGFLMTIAADDGVMPQTREHARVLAALGVTDGVVAITKTDLADPARALEESAALLPGIPAVAVSVRTGQGLDDLRTALTQLAHRLPSRAETPPSMPAVGPEDAAGTPPVVLHVDRVFTIKGAGTVVTGTLWSGAVGRGDRVVLLPAGREARVRSVQVHDEPVERADAGQRVALNLAGVSRDEVRRGDVVASAGAEMGPAYFLDVALDVRPEHGDRVQVHHGTREAPARVAELGGRYFQLRLEQPLIARRGDRLVLRRIAPPDTLGGGVVLDPAARKHGPSRDLLARLAAATSPAAPPSSIAAAAPVAPASSVAGAAAASPDAPPTSPSAASPAAAPSSPASPTPAGSSPPLETTLSAADLALEERLRVAGLEPPIVAEEEVRALREAGRVRRVGRRLHYHPEALAEIERRIRARIERDGSVSLAGLRDELATSRKFAQALLEHFDAAKVTVRRPDDSRVLRRRRV